MFAKPSREELIARLAEIDAAIEAHPLASDEVTRAHSIIESRGDADNAEVDRRLAEQGLPSLAELGKVQVKETASWWRLHRDKKKVEAKLEKLSS